MERQTVALPAKVVRRSMCQGVGNGLRTSSTERNCQVNHVIVVQQDEPGRAAEEILPGDQRVQMEPEPQQQQHAPIPEPSAQPSSSSHEEPMQVSTTPRRIREDESDTRAVRPRLDMSALISELCERCS